MSNASPSMFYVGICRLCGTGPLGLRRCGDCGRVVVLCDECDAVWTGADLEVPPRVTDDPDLPCPHCKATLVGGGSSWASRQEIDDEPWLAKAVSTGAFQLRIGKPFAPNGPARDEDKVEPTDEPLDAGA